MKKLWSDMTPKERGSFLRQFRTDEYGRAHISSTNPAEMARIEENLGGITLKMRKGQLWLCPIFCGGGRTAEDFRNNVKKFNADPANAPFQLHAAECEWEPLAASARR